MLFWKGKPLFSITFKAIHSYTKNISQCCMIAWIQGLPLITKTLAAHKNLIYNTIVLWWDKNISTPLITTLHLCCRKVSIFSHTTSNRTKELWKYEGRHPIDVKPYILHIGHMWMRKTEKFSNIHLNREIIVPNVYR